MKLSLWAFLAVLCLLTPERVLCRQSNSAQERADDSVTRVSAAEPESPAAASTAAAAQEAVPRLIKFNGVLRDLAGKPISGPVDVTFSLYPGEAGGNALWFETQTVQADSLGNYTVLLGAMSATGVPMEIFTSGEAHWLGV